MALTPETQAAKDDFIRARRLTAIELRHGEKVPGAQERYQAAADAERQLRATIRAMRPVDTVMHPRPDLLPQRDEPR